MEAINTKDLTANVWRPIDYEMLDPNGKDTRWYYWMSLQFIDNNNAVGWS